MTILRRTPAALTQAQVEAAAYAALGAEAKVTHIDGNPAIHGYMIEDGSGSIFVISDSSRQYVPPSELVVWLSGIRDPEVRKLAASHKAFVAVDCMISLSPSFQKVHKVLATMAAELIGEECLLLYSTMLQSFAIIDERTVEELRGDEPMALFPGYGVAYFDSNDERMNTAIAEAKRRWPEFLEAYRTHGAKGMFMFKSKFSEDGHNEHMWILVKKIEGDNITGELGNQPEFIRSLKKGQAVTVSQSSMSDWVYAYMGKADGAFTDPQMRSVIMMKKS